MSKKLFSIILIMLLILGISIQSFAANIETDLGLIQKNKVVINEYQMVKDLSLKTDAELSAKGYSSKDINDIRNYRKIYVDHLNKIKQLNDSTLSKLGYTTEQIELLKNFDGSEMQLLRLGSTMTLYSTTSNFRYESTYSKGKLSYGWYWSGVPAYKLKDAVAVSWNDWVVESNLSNVSYYHIISGSPYTTTSATFSLDGNGTEGAGHKFNVSMDDNYYAKSGSGSFDIRSDVHAIKDFYYYIAYGHQQLIPSISFSIGIGGADASISFTTGSIIADSETGSYIY